MLLQALTRYYDILAADPESGIALPDFSMANVSFLLVISRDGELLNLHSLKNQNARGKDMPQKLPVPAQVKKSSGIVSNFLCENSSYALGTDNKGKPKRAKECFAAFRALHHAVLDGVECDAAKAMLAFVDRWNPDTAREHETLRDELDAVCDGGNLVFELEENGLIHQDPVVLKAWKRHNASSDGLLAMHCLVTGETAPVARLHPSIKGVRGAQSSGASLVSFNARAYESYGKTEQQGANAPVSREAAFAYTTVLNHLLLDTAHRLFMGDTTVVFWAESSDPIYQDAAAELFDPSLLDDAADDAPSGPVRDARATREVRAVFQKIANGAPINDPSPAFDENVAFYVLGIAPNASRLSVRFFIQNSFGAFLKTVARHYEHLRIQKRYANDPDILSYWKLLNETVSPASKNKAASPLLAGEMMRSILTGLPYPAQLYNAVLLRLRAGDDLSYCKAAIVKACLIRKTNERYKEELTLGLNENSTCPAYLLGRLFAVLEKAQMDANPKINTTIRERYFSSACTTPSTVFPVLLRLSQHHISKAEYGKVSDQRIEHILNRLEMDGSPFPVHLSLDEQGIFILGYYQQRAAFYTKKEKTNEEETKS